MTRKTPKYPPMINLKVMRIKNGFTLESLSRQTQIHINTLCKYENGLISPKTDNLKKIAAVLNCGIEDIS